MTRFGASVGTSTGGCTVSISNDGPPLPGEPERLFERGVAGPAGGAGLRLSIARELADGMGGTIGAANRPEGGVVFTLTLPAL